MFLGIIPLFVIIGMNSAKNSIINVVDMTIPTTTDILMEHYGAVQRHWKLCHSCGFPALGTAMHLEQVTSSSPMYPGKVPVEYLVTRLVVIDVSSQAVFDPALALTLEVTHLWPVLLKDPSEPTLLLFKFGWTSAQNKLDKSCVCKIPGLSYELAEWIVANLTHVVGVATDAPSFESEQSREFNTKTIASILGGSGVYMIENVDARRYLPEQGCLTIAMPTKLFKTGYVLTRLTAFCPTTTGSVVLAVRTTTSKTTPQERVGNLENMDIQLDDIM